MPNIVLSTKKGRRTPSRRPPHPWPVGSTVIINTYNDEPQKYEKITGCFKDTNGIIRGYYVTGQPGWVSPSYLIFIEGVDNRSVIVKVSMILSKV